MTTDYRQVLKELREEEERLNGELQVVRGAIPAIELMVSKMAPLRAPEWMPTFSSKPYAAMGTKEAIATLLRSSDKPIMPAEITRILLEGGIQTRSNDFASTVGSTLNQNKEDFERKEDGWVIRNSGWTTKEHMEALSSPSPAGNSLSKMFPQ